GKCEGPAFTSAGPHFNPLNKKHGLENAAGPHAGDLPDMYVEKNGAGRYEVLLDGITPGPGETSIFDADGSAIVIHMTADDNVTDPTGNSGDRIACGVITRGAAKKMYMCHVTGPAYSTDTIRHGGLLLKHPQQRHIQSFCPASKRRPNVGFCRWLGRLLHHDPF